MARRLIPKILVIPENVSRGVAVAGFAHLVLIAGVVAAAPQLFGETLERAEVPITIQIFEEAYVVAAPEPAAVSEPVVTIMSEPEPEKAIAKPDAAPEVAVPDVKEGAIAAAARKERPENSGPVPKADRAHDVSVVYEKGPSLSRREELGATPRPANAPPLPTELKEIKAEIKRLEVKKGQSEIEKRLAETQRDKQAALDAAEELRKLEERIKRLEIEQKVVETTPDEPKPAAKPPTKIAAREARPVQPRAEQLPEPPKPKLSAQEILERSERRSKEKTELDARDLERARQTMKRMRDAAKEGIPSAQLEVAKRLDTGKGVKKDREQAKKILERLAKRNYQPAQLELARKLLEGDGVKKDQVRAHVLLQTAADEDNIVAKRALRALQDKLTDEQKRVAETEAKRVRRTIQKQRADNKLTSVQQRSLDNDLRVAIDQGNVQQIESLLRSGADPNAIDASGKDAIIAAAWRGREMVVELLIDGGVDLDAIDLAGRTPLAWASINGYRSIVEILLDHGADPDALDDDRKTALMRAAWNGHLDVAQLLLKHGATASITDSEGKTALDRAREEDWVEVVELLEGLPRAN